MSTIAVKNYDDRRDCYTNNQTFAASCVKIQRRAMASSCPPLPTGDVYDYVALAISRG